MLKKKTLKAYGRDIWVFATAMCHARLCHMCILVLPFSGFSVNFFLLCFQRSTLFENPSKSLILQLCNHFKVSIFASITFIFTFGHFWDIFGDFQILWEGNFVPKRPFSRWNRKRMWKFVLIEWMHFWLFRLDSPVRSDPGTSGQAWNWKTILASSVHVSSLEGGCWQTLAPPRVL